MSRSWTDNGRRNMKIGLKFWKQNSQFDIFEKVMVRGTQKLCSRVCDVKIQKYKYTNTSLVNVANRHKICYSYDFLVPRTTTFSKVMVDEWVVDIISFQKIFGLCGLECHIVEIWGDVTLVHGRRTEHEDRARIL